LDAKAKVFGFGLNTSGQIHSNLPERIRQFTHINMPDDTPVREIAAGDCFSAFLLQNGTVILHGKAIDCKPKALSAPRGLFAYKSHLTLAEKQNTVVWLCGAEKKRMHVRDENVIKTAITETNLLALCASGNVYKAALDARPVFSKVDLGFAARSIFPCGTTFCVSSQTGTFFSVTGDSISALSIPLKSETIGFSMTTDRALHLGSNGHLSSVSLKPCFTPSFSVACFCAFSSFFVCFPGIPSPRSCIQCAPPLFSALSRTTFSVDWRGRSRILFALNRTTCFFQEEGEFYSDFDDFASALLSGAASVSTRKAPVRRLYRTKTGRFVLPEIEDSAADSFNLLPGDIVETALGVEACFTGWSDGLAWLRPTGSLFVYSCADLSSVMVRDRPEHTIHVVSVDGCSRIVDRTPTFCKSYGRSVGDLVWFPKRGIVKFAGIGANGFVFLDYSDDSLFSSEMYSFLLVRTDNRNAARSRKIVTAEGRVVVLDVCSAKRIFQPGDRVLTPYGDATFLGTDSTGNCYVQSDAMRMQEIGGVEVRLDEMRLRRRIGLKAHCLIKLGSGEEVLASVSTNDKVQDFMADDIVEVDDGLFRIVGVLTNPDRIFAEPVAGGDVREIQVPNALVYRADILGRRHTELAEVGSPALELSVMVPGDAVEVAGAKRFVFKGISRSGPLFVDRETKEAFATSFCSLVMADSFKVLQRPVFGQEAQ
jgi:hypothetical protein